MHVRRPDHFQMNVPSTEGWKFLDYYQPAVAHPVAASAINFGRDLVSRCEIASHPFFASARQEMRFLKEWASQECVVTNHFSLALLAMIARVKNVHVRSMLLPVVAGEHSKLKEGVAFSSHPYLLSKLVDDLNIDRASIAPRVCTKQFIDVLMSVDKTVPYIIGVLGVGNESLLIPEYEAVHRAFDQHFDPNMHGPFLSANIAEDSVHSELMEKAAMCLITTPQDANQYMDGAQAGVSSRIRYYDNLLQELGE